MSRNAAVSVLVALTMSTGQLSFAQGNSNRNDRDRDEGRQQEQRGQRGKSPKPERHDNRDFGRSHNQERAKGGRGVGPNYEYYRGDRLPVEYRHRNYVVDDWRGHNLSAPPRGYHWVQSGGDYILVAIATGIIMQILLAR
jgi:Ni/Co efflux regulator RcnB